LLVDRSFCGEQQRQHLVDRHRQLLLDDQLSQQRRSPVLEANVLGMRLKAKAPTLEQFARLTSVGEGDGQQMQGWMLRQTRR
jgi:hypothetical protein